MKKFSILLVLLLFTFIGYSNEKHIPSKIDKVTVFRSGAQVYRTAEFDVPKGESRIYLEGLTRQLDQQSLQIGGLGDFSIISMSFIQDYTSKEQKSELYISLEQKLEDIQYNEVMHRDEIDVLNEESKLILANKKVGSKEGSNVQQLIEMAKFYNERLLAIKRNKQALTRQLTLLNKERNVINKQIQEIRIKNTSSSTGVVVLDISADNATKAKIEMNYLVYSAGWITTYDLRVKNIDSPIDLLSKAMVTQSTGEDWENVHIKISTGNPRRSFILPSIGAWYLDYHQEYRNQSMSEYDGITNLPLKDFKKADIATNVRGSRSEATELYVDGIKIRGNQLRTSENLTSLEFSIEKKVYVPSDGKKHEIKLEHQELKANYEYFAIPKREKAAYLIAKIPDWHTYNLMNGESNIYFEGTYVGKSMINPAQVSDTLDISLGVDIAVSVDYTRIKKETKQKFLSTKVSKNVGWEISIKNGKGQDINITILDQIPVSTQKDIEIELTEKSKGELTKETGIVKWQEHIISGKQQKFRIIYNVKYPKKKQVRLN